MAIAAPNHPKYRVATFPTALKITWREAPAQFAPYSAKAVNTKKKKIQFATFVV